eukprot:TRINITY_DN1783_c0_g1_i1.p1 TRINITY_DN1783_c0_g1~~TRINITY_DN1783_c0_g1_i1.p1  ORF type:complete len:1030 (-),score=41.75 TRINITY_DN1783_c0_g1_i1:2008-5097(-)
MRKFVTVFLCALLTIAQVWAQNRTITGKVTDQKTGQPLVGVTVSTSAANTITDATGNYRINVTAAAKSLTFRFVGYEALDVAIKGAVVNAAMESETKSLEEVVVTGYSREKKSQFSGAATLISSKAVETVPVGSFDQALQGRAPGMLVNSGSGQPGTSPTIRIRGVQSLAGANTQPLYIIDGVPTPDADFQSLNANDFESITVLKDANAAALYGARGGAGVIVITTKRGKSGTASFQYRTQVGFTQRPSFERMNLMNTAEMLAYEEREKLPNTPGWVYSPLNATNLGGISDAREKQILDSIRAIDIDYANIFYRQGISQSHEINMSGGSDRTRYYVSGSYFKQEGIDLGSSLTRYNTRFNIDHSTDKLTVSLNSTIGFSKGKYSEGEQLGNSPLNPFQMTYRAKTYENPYTATGGLNFGTSTSLALKQVANLLERIENSSLTRNQIKINAGLSVAYKILPNLTIKNVFGIDVSSDQTSRYINPNSFAGTSQTYNRGLAQEGYRLISQLTNTSSLVFSKRFAGIHEVEAGAYFEGIRGYNKNLGFSLFNLDTRLTETGQNAGSLPTNGAAVMPQNAASAKSGFGIRSYFGTLRYTYDNKYTVNANVRRDGTSRIVNPQNREITTWSAGFTWNAMQEKFLQNQNILSDLKVRITYGLVPNFGSIGTGNYGNGVSFGGITNYQGPQLPTFGAVTYSGSPIAGQAPNSPGNPDLEIEYVKKWNAGIDFAVWNNRAKFSVDYYNNRTVGLFVSNQLSGTTGAPTTSQNINAGEMTNKGFEFSASVDVVKQKDFNVNVGINHSINTNKIENLGAVNEYVSGTFLIAVGLPYGSHYNYNYLGADPATGAPRYETPTGGVTNNLAQAGRFSKFGSFIPKHQGGATFEIRYKAITVSALFSYQFDVVRSNNIRNWITRGTPGYHGAVRASRELIDGQWQKAGDNKFYQSSAFDRDFTSSDLEDAKFLRFRNLNISYQIPAIKLGNGKNLIRGARFYVQGQNLAIWSPWRGLDPEDDNNISLNEYPNPKMFVAGLDINF